MIWNFKQFIITFLLFNIRVSDTFSQYVSVIRKPNNFSSCDFKKHISLVEHFFNVIFTEFHQTPPVCVCVQMCPERSTYCYPNGCMKIGDIRKNNEYNQLVFPPSTTEFNDTVKPIPNDNDNEGTKNYIDDFLEGNSGIKKALSEPPDDVIKGETHRSNPLKDRYKMVFKYKRLPKKEMRYNLREQVKQMKADKQKLESYDMSSQRWPKGKHWIHSRQLLEATPPLRIDDTKAKKLYMFTENSPSTYTSPKYFKRDASKLTNEEEINVETLYIYQTDTTVDGFNLSVESMIENLIESSFEGLTNLVSLEANNTLNQSVDDKLSANSSLYRAKNAIVKDAADTAVDKDPLKEFTSPIYDENTTTQNENVDDPNIILENKANFLDIIAKMSDKIEQQNNASIEIINRMADHNSLKHFTPKLKYVKGNSKDTNLSTGRSDDIPENTRIKRDITFIDIYLYPSKHEVENKNIKDRI